MKRIVVIDWIGTLINSLCFSKDYEIVLAVVENTEIIKNLRKKSNNVKFFYPREFNTEEDFFELNKNNYNLTYDEINNYRSTQYKVNNFLCRALSDKVSIDCRYYCALSFFLDFFEKNNIDLIISSEVEHGDIVDSIIFDIAKNKKIPTYNINTIFSSFNKEVCVLLRQNDKTFVPVDSLIKDTPDYYSFLKDVNKSFESLKKENRSLRISKLDKCLYVYSYYKEAFKGFENVDLYDRKFKICWKLRKYEKIRQSIYVKNLFDLYNKISESPKIGENYIYFPLHQDPEANTQNRVTLNNQLYIIEKLSEILPENWMLYVKEHPSEFFIYDRISYFYKNINLFRSPDFYMRLKNIRNVRLIKIDEPNYNLLSKSKAVTSICGTSLLESICLDKPVLIFGDDVTILEKISGTYKINCSKSLEEAICKIKNQGDNNFAYDQEEILSLFKKYTFYRSKSASFYLDLAKLCCSLNWQ